MLKIIEEKKARKVGIIYSTDAATAYEVEKVVVPGLKKLNISHELQTYKVGDRDFRIQALSIKKELPDILLTYGFGSDIPFLINTLKEQGVFDKVMAIAPIGVADAIPSKSTKPFAGIFFMAPSFIHKAFEEKNPRFAAFQERYIKRYKIEQFTVSSVYAYDNYSLLAQALIALRSTNPENLMRHFTSKKLEGMAGAYIFNKYGDCSPPVGFGFVEKDGDIKFLKEFK